jgi:hypothetical protein
MRPHEFLHAVRDRAAAHLPDDLRGWKARVLYATLQAHYGNPRLHYEVWLVRKTGRIEIGLHLEADHETSRTWAMRLARHADELRAALGPAVELEDWTASWCRLHETLPLDPLTEVLCDEVAVRLAALVQATQPLLAEIAAPRSRQLSAISYRRSAISGQPSAHGRRGRPS